MNKPRGVAENCTWLLIVAGLCVVAAVTLITIEVSRNLVGM